jgi:hypothetical protein
MCFHDVTTKYRRKRSQHTNILGISEKLIMGTIYCISGISSTCIVLCNNRLFLVQLLSILCGTTLHAGQ